jgi:hypothetical protein
MVPITAAGMLPPTAAAGMLPMANGAAAAMVAAVSAGMTLALAEEALQRTWAQSQGEKTRRQKKENLFTTRMNHETRAIHAIVIPAVCATVDESSMPD